MTAAQQSASGAGLFSKLVVVFLLALAIGLYLKIVMMDGAAHDESGPVASVQVLEGEEAAASPEPAALRDLPEDQMELIRRVFAPDLEK